MSRIVSVPPIATLEDDVSLEEANRAFWVSLLGHLRADLHGQIESILDVGCHNGGLLARLADEFSPSRIFGIEPLDGPRERARFRLRHARATLTLLKPDGWSEIKDNSLDLVTCHEVLHLIEDVNSLFQEISRTLCPKGAAFLVAGCHTENPVWLRWREQLASAGQRVFDRAPLDILRAGINAGLKASLRPLRRDGWVFYDPDLADFQYSSTKEMFDHHYRHKLIFRFVKQP